MIRMTRSERDTVPVMVCDHCNARIDDGALAWYEWIEGPSGPADGTIYSLHKECVDAFEESHPLRDDQMWANGELMEIPVVIGESLRIDWSTAMVQVRGRPRIRSLTDASALN